MVLELDTKLFDKLSPLSLSQFVFISMITGYMNDPDMDISEFPLDILDWTEIDSMIPEWITLETRNDGAKIYRHSKKLEDLLSNTITMFDEFMNEFPSVVIRTDGSKSYLKTNINKSRVQYNKIVGKSRSKHEHIMKCLKAEISDKMRTGKLPYMKTMWKWLVNCEWEVYEEMMKGESVIESQIDTYGTTVI